jgi:hypothetical protein
MTGYDSLLVPSLLNGSVEYPTDQSSQETGDEDGSDDEEKNEQDMRDGNKGKGCGRKTAEERTLPVLD